MIKFNRFFCLLTKRSVNFLTVLMLLCGTQVLYGQTYLHGEPIYPVFEGWRQNEDGTINFMFGYMNQNWEEEPFIPVGENNFFSPGETDRGQPTKFLPRRNRFTFEVTVPADWGDQELVWTLNINGTETTAYATTQRDYLVDNMIIASETGSLGIGTSSPESRANIAPVLSIQGDTERSARVGEPITLTVQVEDDGLPRPRVRSTRTESQLNRAMFRRPAKPTVNKINALYVSWNVYRGGGKVVFEPPQTKVWEDTRASANSPWGYLWLPPEIPEDGVIEVTAAFEEPGTYVLWARADDGGLYSDEYITVNVSP